MITKLSKMAPKGSWLRTRISTERLSSATSPVALKAVASASKSVSNRILNEWDLGGLGTYWQTREEGVTGWRDQVKRMDGSQRERYYDPTNSTFHIVERARTGSHDHLVGRWVSKDRVVFTRELRPNVANPGSPPFWFENPLPK